MAWEADAYCSIILAFAFTSPRSTVTRTKLLPFYYFYYCVPLPAVGIGVIRPTAGFAAAAC